MHGTMSLKFQNIIEVQWPQTQLVRIDRLQLQENFYFKRDYVRSICDRKHPEDRRPGRSSSLIESGLGPTEH